MKLSHSDLLLLSQLAIAAAREAGQIIIDYRHRTVAVKTKIGGDSLASQVVTEVDHLCQDAILQMLMPTCISFDLALLTEESPDDLKRLEKDFFWCIDPLDGTLPFVESTSGYAVSIALVARDGSSHIGVIYDPVEQTLYHAIKNYEVYRNGQPWILKLASSETLTFNCDRSFKQHSLFIKTLEQLNYIAIRLGYTGIETTFYGGAAMNACWVLEKAPACYFKFPKQENGGGSLWDYAASACITLEAGAVASDIYGKPLDLNRADSSFMNHRGVLYATDQELAKQIVDLYARL